MSSRRRRRSVAPARAALAVVLMGAAGLLGGCASARSELGTAESSCYIALPAAYAAVHHHGRLRGVQLVSVTSLRRRAPLLFRAATTAPKPRVAQVCLVAFGGRFTDGHVSRPIGNETGRLAVVELQFPSKRLLATLLITHPPLAFGHPHIG